MAASYQDDELFNAQNPASPHDESYEGPEGIEIDSRVQRAQDQLLHLRRQQELIERQKRELEELSRKQDDLDRGRVEMSELIGRALVHIERETFESEKRLETLRQASETLTMHMGHLDLIDPRAWDPNEIHRHLTKALSEVDAARSDYEKLRVRIASPDDVETLPTYEEAVVDQSDDFMVMLKRGFAFTLPLLVLGVVALIVFLVRAAPSALPLTP
jgi:hypothetical protein